MTLARTNRLGTALMLGQVLAPVLAVALGLALGGPALAGERRSSKTCSGCTEGARRVIDCDMGSVRFHTDPRPIRFTLGDERIRMNNVLPKLKIDMTMPVVEPNWDPPGTPRRTISEESLVLPEPEPIVVRFRIDDAELVLAEPQPIVVAFHLDETFPVVASDELPQREWPEPEFLTLSPDPPSFELVCREPQHDSGR
jgi:hypothetical protein